MRKEQEAERLRFEQLHAEREPTPVQGVSTKGANDQCNITSWMQGVAQANMPNNINKVHNAIQRGATTIDEHSGIHILREAGVNEQNFATD